MQTIVRIFDPDQGEPVREIELGGEGVPIPAAGDSIHLRDLMPKWRVVRYRNFSFDEEPNTVSVSIYLERIKAAAEVQN